MDLVHLDAEPFETLLKLLHWHNPSAGHVDLLEDSLHLSQARQHTPHHGCSAQEETFEA